MKTAIVVAIVAISLIATVGCGRKIDNTPEPGFGGNQTMGSSIVQGTTVTTPVATTSPTPSASPCACNKVIASPSATPATVQPTPTPTDTPVIAGPFGPLDVRINNYGTSIDVYVSYNRPAKDIVLTITRSAVVVAQTTYRNDMYGDDKQVSFALGASGLERGIEYNYRIDSTDRLTLQKDSIFGSFKTDPAPKGVVTITAQ